LCSSHEATSETKVHVCGAVSSEPQNNQFALLWRASHNTWNWLFTWLDLGGKRTAAILSIIATCIAHDVNPRAYLHLVTKLIVHDWSQAKLRDLLPDRILAAHPDLYIGDPDALPALMNAAAVGG